MGNERGREKQASGGREAPVGGQGIWEASKALPLALWVTWTSALFSHLRKERAGREP